MTFKKTNLFYELSLKYLLFGEGKKKYILADICLFTCLGMNILFIHKVNQLHGFRTLNQLCLTQQ